MESAVLDRLVISGVSGEGISLYEVATGAVRNSTITGVGPAILDTRPFKRGVGDGILVRRGAMPISIIALEDNVVSGSARFGIAVDGGDLTIGTNTTTGNGADDGGSSAWATPTTTVVGTASVLDTGTYLLGRDLYAGEGPDRFERPGLR
jgi:hypothetical protein